MKFKKKKNQILSFVMGTPFSKNMSWPTPDTHTSSFAGTNVSQTTLNLAQDANLPLASLLVLTPKGIMGLVQLDILNISWVIPNLNGKWGKSSASVTSNTPKSQQKFKVFLKCGVNFRYTFSQV